jgi:hypothetical protein
MRRKAQASPHFGVQSKCDHHKARCLRRAVTEKPKSPENFSSGGLPWRGVAFALKLIDAEKDLKLDRNAM